MTAAPAGHKDQVRIASQSCRQARWEGSTFWHMCQQMRSYAYCAGAYTMAGSCDFNGFDVTTGVPFYYVTSF